MRTMKLLFACTAFLLTASLRAQTGGGEYHDVIVGPGGSIVQDHPRKPSDYPRTQDTVIAAPQFKYEISSSPVATGFHLDTIKAAKVTNDPLQKLYHSYVRAGFGNYTTLFGEAYFNQLRSKTWNGGVHIRHLSSNDGVDDKAAAGSVAGYSGFSQNTIDLYGKRFLKKHTLSGDLGYDRDVVHFYGSTIPANVFEKEAIVQRFNWFGGGARLLSHYTDSSMINHDISVRYYNFSDIYKASENNLVIKGSGYGYLNTEKLAADIGIDYSNNRTAKDTVNNTILKFQPMFLASGRRFNAMIGVGLYGDINPDPDATNHFYFYPQGEFSFDVYKHIIVPYIGVKGSLDRNSYRSLTQENPFMLPSASGLLHNTQNRDHLYGGLKGSISSTIAYNLEASHMERKNMALFVNTVEATDPLQNKFDIVYDDVAVTTLHGEISYRKNEKLHILAKADYSMFNTANELKAWHTPALRTGLSAQYSIPDTKAGITDKIAAHLDIYYIGSQFARTIDSTGAFKATELKGLFDANIGVEYRYTKFLSFYVNFNNLAAQRYYRWNAYPTQRFNLMGGLTYSF